MSFRDLFMTNKKDLWIFYSFCCKYRTFFNQSKFYCSVANILLLMVEMYRMLTLLKRYIIMSSFYQSYRYMHKT